MDMSTAFVLDEVQNNLVQNSFNLYLADAKYRLRHNFS